MPIPLEADRTRIVVTPHEARLALATIKELSKRGDVFQRAGRLVEPHLDPARKIKGLLRPAEELKLVAIDRTRVRSLAAESIRFVKKDDEEDVDVNVPDYLSGAVLVRPDWPGIPVIESIAENPTLRADGTVHDAQGYDPDTGNYFNADGVVFPPVLPEPTVDDSRAAYDELMKPFSDFPFVSAADKAVVAACILTMLARPAIPGPTPPFVLRTPTPRTGKDLCTDAMTIIGTGRPTPGRTLPSDDEAELKKVLLSLGIAGVRVVSFGNCEKGIGSPALSHAVTREMISDRLLGANHDVSVPLRPVWLFNGNNPYYLGDFGPRVVQCSMDAGVADPQSRRDFKHDPLLPYVRAHRPRLVTAGLTILRAYCVAGRPAHGGSKKGSFEGWDDLVRGALLWAGIADPLASDRAVRMEGDADIEQLAALLSSWRCAFGNRPTTLREAVDASKPAVFNPGGSNGVRHLPESTQRDLAAAFSSLDPKVGDRYSTASLRFRIRHHKGRPLDMEGLGKPETTFSLEMAEARTGAAKVASWYVLDANEKFALPVPPAPVPPK